MTVAAVTLAQFTLARLAECDGEIGVAVVCDPATEEPVIGFRWGEVNGVAFTWATFEDLATMFADHPDYRDEWRP